MAALSLVSSVAGFLFLVIGTREMVQCMNMHKDMFNNFKSISVWMKMKFMKMSKKMSMWMRVNRLCYGHHSLDCHSRFHKLQEGSQPSWLGGISETYLVGLFWLMLSFRVSIDSTDLTISHSIQKMNPSIWQIKPNIQKIFSDFPNKISVHGAVCVALSKLCKA